MGVVRRYIDFLIILLIPIPLVLALFCSSIPTCLFIFKCFLFLFILFLCNIANVAQRTFKIVHKSRSREHGDIISTRTYIDCARGRVLKLPRARYRVTFQKSSDFVCDNGVIEESLLHVR